MRRQGKHEWSKAQRVRKREKKEGKEEWVKKEGEGPNGGREGSRRKVTGWRLVYR